MIQKFQKKNLFTQIVNLATLLLSHIPTKNEGVDKKFQGLTPRIICVCAHSHAVENLLKSFVNLRNATFQRSHESFLNTGGMLSTYVFVNATTRSRHGKFICAAATALRREKCVKFLWTNRMSKQISQYCLPSYFDPLHSSSLLDSHAKYPEGLNLLSCYEIGKVRRHQKFQVFIDPRA